MRVASRSVALIVVGFLCSCSGGSSPTDHASSFVGNWYGTSQMTRVDAPAALYTSGTFLPLRTETGLAKVTSNGLNTIQLWMPEICPGHDKLTASVTGPTTFQVAEFSCAPVTMPPCGDANPTTVHVAGGTGTLAAGVVTMSVTGTRTECGQTFAFVHAFSGIPDPDSVAFVFE